LGIDELISLLWRRRVTFGVALALSLVAVVAATLAVPKTYEATATIFVGQSIQGDLAAQTLDSTQGEQLSRTFSTLATNPSIAEAAGQQLAEPLSRTQLLDRISVSPVERTQLLNITGEGSSPDKAAELANNYAAVFVDRMSTLYRQGRVPTTVEVSAEAAPPTQPARPNVPLYIGFGAALSFLLAAGVALASDRLDRSVRVGKDEESLLGEPILAKVPDAAETLALPVRRRISHDQLTDSLRVLRTNLELAPGSEARAILVTSPGTAEGKTTVARELAQTIAVDGGSVALVEFDLRRPALDLSGAGANFRRHEAGVAEVLAGRCTLEEAIQESPELPDLAVLYSGTLGANTARLLRSPQTSALLGELRQRYEWVVVDSPPLLIADDVLMLTPYLDGSLLVLDAKKTTLPAVRSALGRLRKVDVRVLGLVLNKTEAEPSPYYQPSGFRQSRPVNDGTAAERRRARARS
jgi:polysaccharide biosynthesis transport protein